MGFHLAAQVGQARGGFAHRLSQFLISLEVIFENVAVCASFAHGAHQGRGIMGCNYQHF